MEVQINRKKLIETRYSKGMNVPELAKLAGVAQMTVVNVENGAKETLPSTLKKVCDALGLHVEDVIHIREDAS